MNRSRARQLVKRYASPACILFGMLTGITYATLIYAPVSNYEVRLGLCALFLTGGLMGSAYFESKARESDTVPLYVEQSRVFYAGWFLLGVAYSIQTVGEFYVPPNDSALAGLTSFFVGTIVGTVWGMALILFIGLKADVATWRVVRFPTWVGAIALWIAHRIFKSNGGG